MNGKASQTNGVGATSGLSPSASSVLPLAAVSSSGSILSNAAKPVQAAEKADVLKLKKRIEEMTKDMDKLTEMVQKVTLQQDQQQLSSLEAAAALPELKRKKPLPSSIEAQAMDIAMPDVSMSHMDIEELAALPLLLPESSFSSENAMPFPPPSLSASRETSDNEFVDQLFSAFHEEDEAADWISHDDDSNRPDPELMQRLSDALQLLPREIQEMIVNRLIAAITSTDGFDVPPAAIPAVAAPPVEAAAHVEPKRLAVANKALPGEQHQQQQPLPLAAATLAALLHHYSNQVMEAAGSNSAHPSKKNLKSLPAIPVHA